MVSPKESQESPPSPQPRKVRPRLILKIMLVVLVVLLVTPVVIFYREAGTFSRNAQAPFSVVLQTVKSGWQEKLTPRNDKDTLVFLVLGTNRISNRAFVPELTDSMMLVSLNLKSGRVGLFSIPRDLWSIPYQTKVDAFYVYGHDRYPQKPEQFPTEIVEQLTDIPVDYTIVLEPEAFADIVNAFGGVQVDVTRPFTDTQFPNPNVDVRTTTDPKQLYLTVQFNKGPQVMDGQRALEYVRSRHAEGEEGSDIARSTRQREVITSLFSQMQHLRFYTNVARLGHLYALYNQDFSRYLPVDQLVAIVKALYPIRAKLRFVEGGPTIYPDNPQGSIYHPNFSPLGDGQWVYLIRNQSQFQKEARRVIFK